MAVRQPNLSHLALVARGQLDKLAPGMGQAATFDDALGQHGLVAQVVITHERAAPFAQEVLSVLAVLLSATVADHGLRVFEGAKRVS